MLQHYWSLNIRLFNLISRTLVRESHSSVETQSVYSTTPADWANSDLRIYSPSLKTIFNTRLLGVVTHVNKNPPVTETCIMKVSDDYEPPLMGSCYPSFRIFRDAIKKKKGWCWVANLVFCLIQSRDENMGEREQLLH